MPVGSLADRVDMIGAACERLGERALICSGPSDSTEIPQLDHVKVVRAVNHAAIFPLCRAVVHHGGAGTTAAGLRAGVPTLVLWVTSDQPIWAAQVKELKVGRGDASRVPPGTRWSPTSRRSCRRNASHEPARPVRA